MASILKGSPLWTHLHKNATPTFIHSSSFSILHFPPHRYPSNSAPKSSSSSSSSSSSGRDSRFGSHDLKRPFVSPPPPSSPDDAYADANANDDEANGEEANGEEEAKNDQKEGESHWKALEDQILEDTVPLINIVRVILHSSQYRSGERLSPQHERLILERLLPYHPDYEGKIGCGIDYITVGFHPDFESSRCLFIVRKDGEVVDFSYWKCIKGLVRKNYPLFTDGYIFRQIRQQKRSV